MRPLGIPIPILVALVACGLVSCSDSGNTTEVSYQLSLSAAEAAKLKTDLRAFALQNGYAFIDGSADMTNDRTLINRETKGSPGGSAGLAVQGEIINVTVEPKNSEFDSFIFAQTSAHDEQKVSLVMIYDRESSGERAMAESFYRSKVLQAWTSGKRTSR